MSSSSPPRRHFANLRDNPRRLLRERQLEQRHLYSSLFVPAIVSKLAADERSGIVKTEIVKSISMHCRFIGREAAGIAQVLNHELFKYSSVYGGIVVAFGKSTLLTGSAGSFEHDLRWLFHKIKTTVYTFKPEIGEILRGVVNNRSSRDFVGCLVHTVFNACVWVTEMESHLLGDVADGDEMEFEVTNVLFTSDSVTIHGALVGGELRLKKNMDETQTSIEAKDENVADDDAQPVTTYAASSDRFVASTSASVEAASTDSSDGLDDFEIPSAAVVTPIPEFPVEKKKKEKNKEDDDEEEGKQKRKKKKSSMGKLNGTADDEDNDSGVVSLHSATTTTTDSSWLDQSASASKKMKKKKQEKIESKTTIGNLPKKKKKKNREREAESELKIEESPLPARTLDDSLSRTMMEIDEDDDFLEPPPKKIKKREKSRT